MQVLIDSAEKMIQAKAEAEQSERFMKEIADSITEGANAFHGCLLYEANLRYYTSYLYLASKICSAFAKGYSTASFTEIGFGSSSKETESEELSTKLKGVNKAIYEKLVSLGLSPTVEVHEDIDSPVYTYYYLAVSVSSELVDKIWKLYQRAVQDGLEPSTN